MLKEHKQNRRTIVLRDETKLVKTGVWGRGHGDEKMPSPRGLSSE